jgi:hypothetical protein
MALNDRMISCIINWKGHGGKQSYANLRYYPSIYLEELRRKSWNSLVRIVHPGLKSEFKTAKTRSTSWLWHSVILFPPMSDIYQWAWIPNQVPMAFTVSKVRDYVTCRNIWRISDLSQAHDLCIILCILKLKELLIWKLSLSWYPLFPHYNISLSDGLKST